jgi:hypothetical protein
LDYANISATFFNKIRTFSNSPEGSLQSDFAVDAAGAGFLYLFNLVFQEIFVTLLPGIQMTMNMTTYALNNLWNYLQGLSLSQSDREWLADKLIMPDKVQEDTAKDDSLTEFLKMEGTWSDDAEGEEYYQMMKHRNDGRPLNREIIRQAIAR